MEDFLQKLDKKFDNNEEKTNMIATLLGVSAKFLEFISENHNIETLSVEMLYMMSITASNVMALTSDGKVKSLDLSEKTKPYFMGEQTQQRIYETMKEVVIELYNQIQENEKI